MCRREWRARAHRLRNAAAAALWLVALPATAQQAPAPGLGQTPSPDGLPSVTTPIDLAQCSIVQSDDFSTIRACPGYKGIPVMLTESRRRFFISFGLEASHEKAAEQSLPPYNIPGDAITWRLQLHGGTSRAFAAIVPFIVAGDDGRPYGEVLVVMKLAPGATCQAGLFDTVANPDAAGEAIRFADETAPSFDCGSPPVTVEPFKAW